MLAEAAPEKAERWRRLAFFARVAGDLNGEIEAWQRILAIGADERAQSRLAELMQDIGQPLQAELLLRALAEAAPAEPARWKRLAFQLHEMGDAEGEAQVLQRVLKLTEDAEARERLCSLLPALGRAREALPHLQAHAEAAPGLADRWRRLAELSQQLGAEETEQLAWSRLVGLTGAPKAHARLSEILLKSGRSAEAVPHLRALAEAKPEKLSRWRELAGALRQIEDVDGEIAAWEQMLQRAEDLGAHKRLSELFSAAGRVHEALPHLRAVAQAAPERKDLLRQLAALSQQTGGLEGEIESWLAMLRLGENEHARKRLADLMLRLGRHAEAVPHLRALAEMRPIEAERWTRLAQTLNNVGDVAGERETWLRVLSRGGDLTAHARLAGLFLAADLVADAIPHVRALAEGAPDDVGKWKRLALLLRQIGDAAGERDAWLNVLAAASSAEAHSRLADLFLAENCLVEAAAHVRALAEARPGKAGHWRRLAHLLQRSGDAGGEAEAWHHVLQLIDDEEAHSRLANSIGNPVRGQEKIRKPRTARLVLAFRDFALEAVGEASKHCSLRNVALSIAARAAVTAGTAIALPFACGRSVSQRLSNGKMVEAVGRKCIPTFCVGWSPGRAETSFSFRLTKPTPGPRCEVILRTTGAVNTMSLLTNSSTSSSQTRAAALLEAANELSRPVRKISSGSFELKCRTTAAVSSVEFLIDDDDPAKDLAFEIEHAREQALEEMRAVLCDDDRGNGPLTR